MCWLLSWFSFVGVLQQLQKSLGELCTKTQASENFRPAPGTVCCSLFSGEAELLKDLLWPCSDCYLVIYILFFMFLYRGQSVV